MHLLRPRPLPAEVPLAVWVLQLPQRGPPNPRLRRPPASLGLFPRPQSQRRSLSRLKSTQRTSGIRVDPWCETKLPSRLQSARRPTPSAPVPVLHVLSRSATCAPIGFVSARYRHLSRSRYSSLTPNPDSVPDG